MANGEHKLSNKVGLPPGSLIHIGKRKSTKQKITVIDYNEHSFKEHEIKSIDECFEFRDKKSVSWINIDGLHDVENIAKLGEHFNIHPLVLEDLLNTNQRPHIEDHDDFLFISLKMLGLDSDQKNIISEQVSFILGETWLISFQEKEGDIFDAIRQRLRENKGTIRKRGNDFLLYRLIDTVVDHYFFIIEHINEKIEKLDSKVLIDDTNKFVLDVQKLKSKVISFRRVSHPLREIILSLKKDQNEFLHDNTVIYFDDVYDHVIEIQETIENQKESLTSLIELHTSLLGHKMNQIMKVLTIMASIFIPLTFVAGIYGMNFEYMPELSFKYGYFAIWGIMLVIFFSMVYYFYRKKWL